MATVPLLLNPEQAAASLSISPRKLWDLRDRGEIPYLKVGRLTRYAVDDLRAYVARNRQGVQANI